MFLGGLKTFLYPPNIKTESGKFHEILTSVCVGGSNNFFIPPKLLVGGSKTETGKFLLHFQNSKSSYRCRSVYGTDIKSMLRRRGRHDEEVEFRKRKLLVEFLTILMKYHVFKFV